MSGQSHHNRRDFEKGQLDDIGEKDPLKLFSSFYQEAQEHNAADPHAMVLSTASSEGQPFSRIVYMRELLEEGIVFYTNYNSDKGQQLKNNDKVALLFYWDVIERQVRVHGTVSKVPEELSDQYFAGRPRISQIGAWASEQSSEIDSRASLEERVKFYEEKYPNEVPRPPHWGGFIVTINYYEFWQGRLGRLHDRICFEKEGEGWRVFRRSP